MLDALITPKHQFGNLVRSHCGYNANNEELYKQFIQEKIQVFPLKLLSRMEQGSTERVEIRRIQSTKSRISQTDSAKGKDESTSSDRK